MNQNRRYVEHSLTTIVRTSFWKGVLVAIAVEAAAGALVWILSEL